MYRPRVIPCLLLRGQGLVKTRKFKDPVYLGDPINAVRIFSEKEVDELVILDIQASRENRPIDFELIAELAGECFMPVCYGGGVRSADDIRRLVRSGIEKVAINTASFQSFDLIQEAAASYGSQALVGAIDVKRNLMGRPKAMAAGGTKDTGVGPVEQARALVDAGVGEIFLNSIDRDGTYSGYDIDLIRTVSGAVSVPVVACGGAGSHADFGRAIREGGASAVAAGSLFVYYGKHRAVLINYPAPHELPDLD